MKVYILSPHIDDAAFSLALTISRFTDNNIPVTIINCFTVTKWTAIPVKNKEIEAVSRLRKNEDAKFYKKVGDINIINLDLLDAPLRNGYIFQNQPFQQNEWELIETLKKLLEQNIDGLLLCPLAIGNHIDHAIGREAMIALYTKLDVIFFEDLPYAQRISEDQIRRHVHILEDQLEVEFSNYIISSKSRQIDKKQSISVYESQLNEEIASEIISHFNAWDGERIWGEIKNMEILRSIFSD